MRSRLFLWLQALLFTLVAPGTVLGLIPGLLLSDGRGRIPTAIGVGEALGVGLIAVGVALYVSCLRLFVLIGRGTPAPVKPPSVMVAKGAYRYVRNPMYIGVVTALFGEALLFWSLALAIFAGAMWAAFHLFVVLYEEPTLTSRFGDNYRSYQTAVARWWPRGGGG